MKIEEAVKILDKLHKPYLRAGFSEGREAVSLAIEALNAVNNTRLIEVIGPLPLLPGETTEPE